MNWLYKNNSDFIGNEPNKFIINIALKVDYKFIAFDYKLCNIALKLTFPILPIDFVVLALNFFVLSLMYVFNFLQAGLIKITDKRLGFKKKINNISKNVIV